MRIDCSGSDLAIIDQDALQAISAEICDRSEFTVFHRSKWGDPLFWNVDAAVDERSQYFALGNAVNFRFWSVGDGQVEPAVGVIDGQEFRGSMYMWRSLRVCQDRSRYPLLEARFLEHLTEGQFDSIFGDDSGFNPLQVAKNDRLANLRDFGRRLRADWDGSFYAVVQASGNSLVEFVKLSQAFRAFDDPTLKLTMVNAIQHVGSGIADFDSEPLPAIDYHLLKQLLRQGVVRPRPDLRAKIVRREKLEPHEGTELRRVALCAFIEIAGKTGISCEILDNRWWWNRTQCTDENPVCLDARTAERCPFLGSCAQLTDLPFPLEDTRYY